MIWEQEHRPNGVTTSKSRDDEIYLGLVDEYWRNVWSYIYAVVGDHAAASDLTQDAFLRVYLHMDSLRHSDGIRSWIFRIAKNVCIDYYRSARMRRVLPVEPQRLTSLAGVMTETPEDTFVRVQQQEEVNNAILMLKRTYREVIILRLKEELEFKEIAKILGQREVTVRARYRRALTKLRNIYEQRELAQKGDDLPHGLGNPTEA
jgi:RNA polymerase sigma-70 factor (ECF subfamily)